MIQLQAPLRTTLLLLIMASIESDGAATSPARADSALSCAPGTGAQTPSQPKVAPGPDEPDWEVVLRDRYGLSMFGDLKNPVKSTALNTPGLFRKAGDGPVRFRPMIALGLVTRNRGGWYRPLSNDQSEPKKIKLWSYVFKNTSEDVRNDKNLPPPLDSGSSTEFDPGKEPFGLWVSNDGLADGGVFSEPKLVSRFNKRLAKQPYKVMIYQNKDKATARFIPNSYLIGWEYSTNDDFQDVVCQIDNVILIDEPAANDR
jgi:hypothetical protein